MSIKVSAKLMSNINHDEINNLVLRSDIENDNIFGTTLTSLSYVGNRSNNFVGEHEDDIWAIDCLTEDNDTIGTYLYVSELEYTQDCELLTKATE